MRSFCRKCLCISFCLVGFVFWNNDCPAQQKWKPGDPLIINFGDGDSSFSIQPYALIRFALTASDNELYLNDPGTRIGLNLRQPLGKNVSMFGKIELSLKMVSNGSGFELSPGNSTTSQNLNASTVPSDNVFGIRKTYIGFDFGRFGQVSVGKQCGAYFYVGDRTDISEANSAYASYVYSPEGSDGGLTGTGRANSCLAYENTFAKRIHFTTSLQMNFGEQADSLNSHLNSLGASAIIDIYKGFDVAVGYHHVFMNSNYTDPDLIYGLSGDPDFFIVGAQYLNKGLRVSVNYAMQHHGDLTTVQVTDSTGSYDMTSVYSGTGFEAAASYVYQKWKFLAGINLKDPEQDQNEYQSSDFGKSIIFYGLQYRPVKNIATFFEGRVDNSKDANGNALPGLNMIGVRIDI